MMRALITGGCGFIGSNLVKRCVEQGWEVDVVDDLSNGQMDFLPTGPDGSPSCRSVFVLDFSDSLVLSAIRGQFYDVVIHLAAIPRVSYSVEHPLETHDVNVTKTLKLLDACRDNVNRFVFASSSSVYGGAEQLPTPETTPKHPKSPYALQKSIIEDYLKLYHRTYGIDTVSLRFFNVFGPHGLGNSAYATAVSAWLTAIKLGKPMRSDGDGTQTRDLCYVDNVVDACIRAAECSTPLTGECFNVGCGDRISNNEIARYLLLRYENAYRIAAPWRAGDVMHTQADVSKAKRILGYVPLVGSREGIERTANWYDANWDGIKNLKLRT